MPSRGFRGLVSEEHGRSLPAPGDGDRWAHAGQLRRPALALAARSIHREVRGPGLPLLPSRLVRTSGSPRSGLRSGGQRSWNGNEADLLRRKRSRFPPSVIRCVDDHRRRSGGPVREEMQQVDLPQPKPVLGELAR